MRFLSEILDKQKHDRSSFDCGEESLNAYFKTQASQDMKRNLAVCFVVVKADTRKIIGYYTLSNSSITKDQVGKDLFSKLKTAYPVIPTTLIGRLAINNEFKGKGHGRYLVVDALVKAYDASKNVIGSYAVVVDPINDSQPFYEKFGFVQLDSGKMFMEMKKVERLIEG